MKRSNLLPLSLVAAVVVGLIAVDHLTDVDWPWFAVAIALAATLAQLVRPNRGKCSGGWR